MSGARATRHRGFYDRDLARIHHEGFGGYARGAAPGLLDLLHCAGIDDGRVADLGCGSGIWLEELERHGYEPWGCDLSRPFATMARARVPGAEIRVGSMHDLPLPRCRAVTATGEVLSYLPPGGGSAPSLDRIVRRVARALDLGGLFVFDLVVSEPRVASLTYRRWWSEEDWSMLIESIETRGRVTREITTFVKRSGGRDAPWDRRRERHLLRVFDPRRVEASLRRAGFRVRRRWRIGSFSSPPRRVFFVARLDRPS